MAVYCRGGRERGGSISRLSGVSLGACVAPSGARNGAGPEPDLCV